MSYQTFKAEVLRRAGWLCENPNCDAQADGIHHLLKRSRFPQYGEDIDNGVAMCGPCHSELERRLREGGDWKEMVPVGRYRAMLDKAGLESSHA